MTRRYCPQECLSRENTFVQKDLIYLGLIAVSAIVCFLNGVQWAEARFRRQRKLEVPFNDSGCLTELPANDELAPLLADKRISGASPINPSRIRSLFGNN